MKQIYVLTSLYSYDNTTVPPTTGVPPSSVSENATSTTGGTDEAYQGFFFQAGYRFKGLFTNTITIPLNGTINTNVWHDLRLVIDKDSNNTIEIFFDDKYVGSFIEFLPPRDVGGVMTVNRDIALFKNFEVGQCPKMVDLIRLEIVSTKFIWIVMLTLDNKNRV